MTLHASPLIAAALLSLGMAAMTATTLSAQTAPSPAPSPAPSGPMSTRPGLPGAPPRDSSAKGPAAAVGTGVVRGRVVALDTGLPLRRARVMLFAGTQPRVTMTDADGAFTFTQVPAGRIDVRGSKARYVDTPLGARRAGGPGRPIELADGQAMEGLVLALPPAGVITGRIVDDGGDVVTGVSVMPMRFRTINGERQLTPTGQARSSDDTGTFRLYGLPPGKYYLSARAEESRFGGDVDPDATGFAPTFYPGTAVAAEAQAIEVVAGAEVVADLQLVTTRMTTITGVVVDAAGTPASGGHLMVAAAGGNSGRFMWGGGGGGIKPDGTFTLSGIAPGDYTLIAQATFGQPSMFEAFGSGDGRKTASASVVASGAPITGLRLVVQDPIRIPVTVTFDDSAADKPERVSVSANAERGMSSGMAIMRDGRLSLDVVPGSYRLFAGAMSARPWFVKRLAYRGREVDGEEVELTAEPGGRIDVVFTTKSSKVDGGVTGDNGKPITDYTVIIVPESAEAARQTTFSRIRMVTPDAQGRFRAEHLKPGAYVATAIADVPIEDIYDTDFLDGVRRAGQPFRVVEGGTATLDLRLSALP